MQSGNGFLLGVDAFVIITFFVLLRCKSRDATIIVVCGRVSESRHHHVHFYKWRHFVELGVIVNLPPCTVCSECLWYRQLVLASHFTFVQLCPLNVTSSIIMCDPALLIGQVGSVSDCREPMPNWHYFEELYCGGAGWFMSNHGQLIIDHPSLALTTFNWFPETCRWFSVALRTLNFDRVIWKIVDEPPCNLNFLVTILFSMWLVTFFDI